MFVVYFDSLIVLCLWYK